MPDETTIADEHTRYFIITLGRCGSSLLGAVLSDADADFGLPVPDNWDPRRGQMEGRAIKLAAHHYRRAYDIAEGRKFILSPVLEQKYRQVRAKRFLKQALAASRFVKVGDLDLVVQPSFKLGYRPRVILNYRQFEPLLPSLLVGRTHVGPDQLAREYVRIYRQGLLLMQTFGGCTVEYNELLDAQTDGWANSLATITGLDRQTLLDSRRRRVNGTPDPRDIEPVYLEAFELFTTMRALSGRVIDCSRQATRAAKSREQRK